MNAKTEPVHSSEASQAESSAALLSRFLDKDTENKPSIDSIGYTLPAALAGANLSHGALSREGLLRDFDVLFDCAKAMPKEVLREVVASINQRLQAIDQEQLREVPPLPQSYQRYTDTSQDPYDWLGTHWGAWLKHFTPSLSRDYLFLDQLGELDPELKRALYAKRRSILTRTELKVSQIIPKKSVRLDYQIQQADPDALKSAVRTYALPKVRKSREQKKL